MPHQNDQTVTEKTLIERLAQLSVPIHITRYALTNNEYRYEWKTSLTGSGDCDTFEDAVIQAMAYQQEHRETENLVATSIYSYSTIATLGECLRRTFRVRPTAVLYLYLGTQDWLDWELAYDLIVKSRSIGLSWDAYIEDGQGPDPVGIYLFGPDGKAYRSFAIEMKTDEQPQRGTLHIIR